MNAHILKTKQYRYFHSEKKRGAFYPKRCLQLPVSDALLASCYDEEVILPDFSS